MIFHITLKINPELNWPYDKPQFIILNVAMGGDLGGEIPSDFNESSMQIDYVESALINLRINDL